MAEISQRSFFIGIATEKLSLPRHSFSLSICVSLFGCSGYNIQFCQRTPQYMYATSTCKNVTTKYGSFSESYISWCIFSWVFRNNSHGMRCFPIWPLTFLFLFRQPRWPSVSHAHPKIAYWMQLWFTAFGCNLRISSILVCVQFSSVFRARCHHLSRALELRLQHRQKGDGQIHDRMPMLNMNLCLCMYARGGKSIKQWHYGKIVVSFG